MARTGAAEMAPEVKEAFVAWIAPIWWAERRAMDICARWTHEVGGGFGDREQEADKLFLCRQASDELRHYRLYTSLMKECGVDPWEAQARYVDAQNPVVRQKPERAPVGMPLDDFVAPGVVNDLTWTCLATQFAAENLAIVVFDHIYSSENLADGVRDVLDGIISDESVHAEYGEERVRDRLESGEIGPEYIQAVWPALVREIKVGTDGAWTSFSEEAVKAKELAEMHLPAEEIVARSTERMATKLAAMGVEVPVGV